MMITKTVTTGSTKVDIEKQNIDIPKTLLIQKVHLNLAHKKIKKSTNPTNHNLSYKRQFKKVKINDEKSFRLCFMRFL